MSWDFYSETKLLPYVNYHSRYPPLGFMLSHISYFIAHFS